MKKLIKYSVLSIALLLSIHDVALSQSKVGTSAAPFLTIGTGARASGLGDAYTAIATGPDALFWNPAGMSIRDNPTDHLGSVLFTNKEWFADIRYSAVGATAPVSSRGQVVGVHLIYLDYGRMDIRTVDQPDGTGATFGAFDMSAGVSFSSPVTQNFYVGGTVKYIEQKIYDMRASTVAIDIGFTLITPYINGLRMAASLSNFGGKMQMDGINTQFRADPFPGNTGAIDNVVSRYYLDQWDIPVMFKFGIMVPAIKTESVELQFMAESQQTNDQHLNADYGSQFIFRTQFVDASFRLGYKDFPLTRDFKYDMVDSHWTFGVGFLSRISTVNIGVDFAYVPFNNLGSTTMIDFRLYF